MSVAELSAPAIPDSLVAQLVESTRDVLATMAHMTLTTGTPLSGDALRPRSNVVGTVSFAGQERGIVAFYSTFDAAASIAAAMLGVAVDKNEEIADAVGELTNMIAGSFRNHLAADGQAWAISIPAVTIGSDFYTKYVSDVRRVLCPFRSGPLEIFVELILLRH